MFNYHKFWCQVAALLLADKYKIVLMLCYPGENDECVHDHKIVTCEVDQIKGYAENHYAPGVYAAPANNLPKNMDEMDSDGVFWLGDISRDGENMCGDLLSWMLDDKFVVPPNISEE